MNNVIKFPPPWEVYEFSWGTAVKHRKGRWSSAFISNKDGTESQYIDFTKIHGTSIEIDDAGIRFLS